MANKETWPEWLKRKGQELKEWWNDPKTQKAFANAGAILGSGEYQRPGTHGYERYEEAINEEDPDVKERQNAIIATMALTPTAYLPGATQVYGALGAVGLAASAEKYNEAKKSGDEKAQNDALASGIAAMSVPLSSLSKIPKSNYFKGGFARSIFDSKRGIKAGDVQYIPAGFSYKKFSISQLDDAHEINTSVANEIESGKELANLIINNRKIKDAAERGNRVAKMFSRKLQQTPGLYKNSIISLGNKDLNMYNLKNVNNQIGGNGAAIEYYQSAKFSGPENFVVGKTSPASIIVLPERPTEPKFDTFHETMHGLGFGAENGMSGIKFEAKPITETSQWNKWKAERLFIPQEQAKEIGRPKAWRYLTDIDAGGNEFAVNMLETGIKNGYGPWSEYPGAAAFQKEIYEKAQKDANLEAILQLVRKTKDQNGNTVIQNPGYLFRALTGQYKNGGKITDWSKEDAVKAYNKLKQLYETK